MKINQIKLTPKLVFMTLIAVLLVLVGAGMFFCRPAPNPSLRDIQADEFAGAMRFVCKYLEAAKGLPFEKAAPFYDEALAANERLRTICLSILNTQAKHGTRHSGFYESYVHANATDDTEASEDVGPPDAITLPVAHNPPPASGDSSTHIADSVILGMEHISCIDLDTNHAAPSSLAFDPSDDTVLRMSTQHSIVNSQN